MKHILITLLLICSNSLFGQIIEFQSNLAEKQTMTNGRWSPWREMKVNETIIINNNLKQVIVFYPDDTVLPLYIIDTEDQSDRQGHVMSYTCLDLDDNTMYVSFIQYYKTGEAFITVGSPKTRVIYKIKPKTK
jgi:hypothetical protein